MSITHTITKYVERTLGLLWKRKLTSVLHDKYFRDTISITWTELAGSSDQETHQRCGQSYDGGGRKSSGGYASFLSAGLFNICSGTFYLAKLWNEYGFLYAGLPFGYIFAAALAHDRTLSYRQYLELTRSKAQYRNGQTRLVVHSEAVASLRGGEREASILSQMFSKLVQVQRALQESSKPQHGIGILGSETSLDWMWLGYHRMGCVSSALSKTIESLHWYVVFSNVGVIILLLSLKYLLSRKSLKHQRSNTGTCRRRIQVRLIHTSRVGCTERKSSPVELQQIEVRAEESTNSFRFWAESRNITRIPTRSEKVIRSSSRTWTSKHRQNLLVKSLSFDVGTQSSLLLTGHNGAGKSSIFRTLAGLWKIDQGTIMKPPTSSTFYLPQKPYNVVGTRDQITYPERVDREMYLRRRWEVYWVKLSWSIFWTDLVYVVFERWCSSFRHNRVRSCI